MKELKPRKLSAEEIWEKRKTTKFAAELSLNAEIYRAQLLVQSLAEGEVLVRPSMRNFIHIIGDPRGEVLSADDVKELNHGAALMANILGNTYPWTEMLNIFPNSQLQSIQVSRWLERSGMFGEVSTLFDDDKASRTMPDGFYYEYSGTGWKVRPSYIRGFMLSVGIPYREDMELGITRRPDYRVPAELIMNVYLIKTIEERAMDFTAALERYSSGAMKVDIDL